MGHSVEIIDTADIPVRDRVAFIRDGLGCVLGHYDMRLTVDTPPRQRFTLFGGLSVPIAHVATTPCAVRRMPDAKDGDVVLNIMVAGGDDHHRQIGREARLRSGEAMLGLQYEPFECTCVQPYTVEIVRLSRAEMALRLPDVEAAAARVIRKDNAALILLRSYMKALRALPTAVSDIDAATARRHIHDLAALAIGTSAGGRDGTLGIGARAARLIALKQDIAANLSDAAFDITAAARRHGVSPRYIRVLFQPEGGFHAYQARARIAAAAVLLADPAMCDRKVIDIAFRCGFNSLATFNRSFTRIRGHTPSSLRP